MAADPYRSDYVSNLRTIAARTQQVYFDATALRRPAAILGYDAALAVEDLDGANADLTVTDVANVNALYDAIDGIFAQHPDWLQSLLKMARGGRA